MPRPMNAKIGPYVHAMMLRVNMCMRVYIRVCFCVMRMYICICMCVMRMYIRICMCVMRMYIRIYMRVVRMYICICMCVMRMKPCGVCAHSSGYEYVMCARLYVLHVRGCVAWWLLERCNPCAFIVSYLFLCHLDSSLHGNEVSTKLA